MRRFVFTPRWMLGHLLVAAAVASCLWLGDWQWTRALRTEDVQNWGYALQWPLFAVFFAIAWWRMLRLESRRLDELAEPGVDPVPSTVLAPPVVPASAPEPVTEDVSRADGDREDAALAAYNRMLAALAAQDAERERSSS